jgi:hypothetical protein
MNYYENYAKQMKNILEEYEKLIAKNKNLTEDYVKQRKTLFKDLEDKFAADFNKIQCLNVTDLYLNTKNINLPKMYWDIYVLWLEKTRTIYQLDNEYMKNLMGTSVNLFRMNPFFNSFNVYDLFKHFNIVPTHEK